MIDTEKQAIFKLLEDADKNKFYGEITFRFRDGKIYNILKGQSLMLQDLMNE